MKKISLWIIILFTLVLFGCTVQVEQPILESIVIDEEEVKLNIGDSYTIEYSFNPSDVSASVIWSVENDSICSIDDGTVLATGFGSTVVTVMSRNDSSICDTIVIIVEQRLFNITYQFNGGHFEGNYVDQFKEGVGLATLPTPIKEGYRFIGWKMDDNMITSIDSSICNDVVLFAEWEEIPPTIYNITYVLNGGSFDGDVVTTFIEGVGVDNLPIPTKDGFEFIGWVYDELDTEYITSISSLVQNDVELIALWEEIIIEHSIEYVLDGGEFVDDVSYSYIEGVGLNQLPIPTKEGYEFTGWYVDGELVEFIDESCNSDLILVAGWKLIDNSAIIDSANVVINLIYGLPYRTTYSDLNRINYAKSCYDELSDEAKALVTNIDILNEKIAIINEIENNVNEITYVLGTNTASSKDDLFVLFFSDFYNYIKNYHGLDALEAKGINNIDDFLDLASDYDAGRGQMREIGDLVSRYMLVKDLNGIIANQPETTFIGFCHKNNLYTDLLPFFIRFFAYWRIDEGYANSKNYGADFFAEGWAPSVDIAKFFYYDSNTTYVKSERMLDCFNFTSNVVYGNLPTELKSGMVLPTDLVLRGYTFAGWYDNPEFNGSPITVINNTSKKVILYAKWDIDTVQQDKDNAELVDVYINNLTTTVADCNKRTVSYVSDMYENLSINARKQVTKYSTLIDYEAKFADYFLNPVVITVTSNFDGNLSISSISEQFLIDFNNVTNSKLASLDELINKKYSYMSKMREFYQDSSMRAKWGYLIDLTVSENCFAGLQIQAERIKNDQSGDLEYFICGLVNLLLSKDATNNSEILVDYSKKETVEAVINQFGTFSMTFEFESYIPTINMVGYEFVGYFDHNNNPIYKVTENMETNLVALYVKK